MTNQNSPGWTAQARSTFLATLAASGIVRTAAQSVQLSTQSAYALRGRDPRFARAWDSAVAIARDHLVAHLTDAAIDGWTEEIWYKGECVGERRRRNPMLAMRLLERLDRLAANQRDNIHHFDDQLRAEAAGLPIDGADVVAIHVLEERRDTAARFGQRREVARLDDAIANMAFAQPPDRCDHPDCAACDAAFERTGAMGTPVLGLDGLLAHPQMRAAGALLDGVTQGGASVPLAGIPGVDKGMQLRQPPPLAPKP